MKKIKMTRWVTLTFEEGCKKYLENCRQRNLREGTIGHYRQSYVQFYKYLDPKMPIEDINEQTYKDYVLHLKSTSDNDISINSYLRDLITTLHFFMNEGWIPTLRCRQSRSIKAVLKPIVTRNSKHFSKSPMSRNVPLPSIKVG